MCVGGSRSDNSAQLQQQAQLQREQMDMQRQQMQLQQQQYQEQLRISTAPPPPAPNQAADTSAPALENSAAASPSLIRQGMGRRKLRTDMMAGGTGGLSIPAV